MQRLLAVATVATAACLHPLVDDQPGASANVLPSNATIKPVTENADLLNQIILNDTLDSKALMASGGVIRRGAGQSEGKRVMFWAFGATSVAPAPLYLFGTGDPTSPSFQVNDHPPLVDSLPGDDEYNPIHTIYRVAVTGRYHGEKITTTGALADAIEIGLVEAPVATRIFVNWPIVRPGVTLEVADGMTVASRPLYGHGYIVDGFQLGGALGMQPTDGLLPTSQVSFLRAAGQGKFDPTRPIFQAAIPGAPPQTLANYTPLSVVVDVDLVAGSTDAITKDGDLFTRTPPVTGPITGTTSAVLQFTVTAVSLDLQLQFSDGAP